MAEDVLGRLELGCPFHLAAMAFAVVFSGCGGSLCGRAEEVPIFYVCLVNSEAVS